MNIILTSHGNFCIGIYESYKMIAGTSKNIFTMPLDEKGIGNFKIRLQKLLQELSAAGDILILCDIKGGTPYNECYAYFLEHPQYVRVISGLNLPMLLEVGINYSSDLSEATKKAENSGKIGIEIAQESNYTNEEIDF